jgi:hypothetical protein
MNESLISTNVTLVDGPVYVDGHKWVGDFPPDNWSIPVSPRIPNPMVWPEQHVHYIQVMGPVQPLGSNWRICFESDRLIASIDLPGAKSANVHIDGSVINVTGTRADTHVAFHHYTDIGGKYDPATASATLEAGVLTIVLMQRQGSTSQKVPVTIK